MRIVILLVVAAMLGMILVQWLGHKPPLPVAASETTDSAAPPAIPTRPEDLKKFNKDINQFMQDAARRRQENAP
ncbi:MAG: hypothetical protein KDI50_12705 [Candidatus Competibacteraceae bacterium]|nr:hypothetical protein [Candidatus Competibacteraceae bacterium]